MRMYFENINTGYYEDNEYNFPLKAKVKELKKEKENLDEYFRQLMFIKNMLEYICLMYDDMERHNLKIPLQKNQEDINKIYIIEGLNILLHDCPSQNNSFSKAEINEYILRLREEISNTDRRINRIIQETRRYEGASN